MIISEAKDEFLSNFIKKVMSKHDFENYYVKIKCYKLDF